MTDEKILRPSFEMSIDTRIVYDRLKKAAIGEVVSFTALSDDLGRTVEGDSAQIQSAIRRLLNEGVVFENIRKVGYKRLNDIEIVGTAERDRESIRRRAKKTVKRLMCVEKFDALPNALKIKHNAAVSGFGAIAAVLTPSSIKRLESAVEKAREQLPLAKTLEAFRN